MSSSTQFSIPEARAIVRDLFTPNPWIYWIDFLVSLTIGYSAGSLYLMSPLFSWQQIVGFVVAVFALYRVANFMHEIVHFRRGEMVPFRIAWNVLAGIPMLMPTFFYESHLSHHNTTHYGTGLDGEYLPLGNGPWRNLMYFMSQVLLQPIVVVARFAFLTPISFLSPRLRDWTLAHASSFVINFRYCRNVSTNAPRTLWALMDIACCFRAWLILLGPVIAYLFPHPLLESVSALRAVQLYAIAVSILTLNYIRTLGAHRYLSEGEKMNHVDQLLDSVDIVGDPIFTELLCPVGLRFHGLHHLFPALPYHNLGKAHRRLMQQLPPDAAYRKIVFPNFFAALADLTAHIRTIGHEHPCGAERWYQRRNEQLRVEREEAITADDLV